MTRGALALALAVIALAAGIGARATSPGGVNAAAVVDDRLPRTLSEFGFFVDGAGQIPAAGVTPYRLNTALYSDEADKLRFVYVPPAEQARANGEGLLEFPVGSALIKTFAYGAGGERRLIETRVLLHRPGGWEAIPYVWNAEQTEATLAIAGARRDLVTPSGEAISYRVPNKNQCKECHGLDRAVVPIGPKARNLPDEFLLGLYHSGRLDAVPVGFDHLPVWERRADDPADAVARAYLDVNCAHCHRPGAMASNSGLDLRWEQHDRNALGVMKRPVAAGRGAGHLLFGVVPGKPEQSIMVHRMASNEPGVAMPELGKATVDREGVEAVSRWIAEMRQ